MTLGTPLDSYLDAGEHLLWSGQPRQGVRLQASDWLAIPFSLLWCGFAFVWETVALGAAFSEHAKADPRTPAWVVWLFPLWGVPFVLAGLYIVFGRFFVDALRRKKTWYGITDRRVIVVSSGFSTNVATIDYINLTNLNLVERKDNSGDVLFGLPAPYAAFIPACWPTLRRQNLTPGFYQLPQARTVYNQIRELQQKARTRT
jgi:hypothetical protein